MTVSTSRYSTRQKKRGYVDESGDMAERETRELGHEVAYRSLVSDDRGMLRREVRSFLAGTDDVLLLTGGTGVAERDVTIETVRPFFQKELDGFGELFRKQSFEEVGSAAMLTRATMGVAKGKVIVCMPGSPGAVRTAMRLVGGVLPHAVHVARS